MSSRPFRRLAWLAATSTLFVAQFAAAQATGGPSAAETAPPGASRPPAKEAIDACVGKAAGDRVQFVDAKKKKRKWVCVMVDGTLAARSGIATPAHTVKPK
jgi:hypothetical protein